MIIKIVRQVKMGTLQSVTATNTGSASIAENKSREAFALYNPGPQTVHFAFGENATANHMPILPGGYLHDVIGSTIPTNEIRLYSTSDQVVRYLEG